jgi:steroid delta-isomerase-like uncharacterized protein
MTREEIAALVERRQHAMSRLDAAVLAGFHADDGVLESPFAGGIARGREAIEKVYAEFFRAFTTVTIRQEDVLIDGDRAVLLLRLDGVDRGGLMGMPPTGRSFSVPLVSLCEFRDGFIARERRIYDFTGLLIQVGAIKAKPA